QKHPAKKHNRARAARWRAQVRTPLAKRGAHRSRQRVPRGEARRVLKDLFSTLLAGRRPREHQGERVEQTPPLLGIRRVPQRFLVHLELEAGVAPVWKLPPEPRRCAICSATIGSVSAHREAVITQPLT